MHQSRSGVIWAFEQIPTILAMINFGVISAEYIKNREKMPPPCLKDGELSFPPLVEFLTTTEMSMLNI